MTSPPAEYGRLWRGETRATITDVEDAIAGGITSAWLSQVTNKYIYKTSEVFNSDALKR